MNLNLEIVSILFILLIIFIVIYLLRKGSITVKYSLVWILSCLVLLLFIIFPNFFNWVTKQTGFTLGSNLVFAVLIGMLMVITLALTVITSNQNNKIRLLIQEVSILKEKSK